MELTVEKPQRRWVPFDNHSAAKAARIVGRVPIGLMEKYIDVGGAHI